jgi:hypothetical protein
MALAGPIPTLFLFLTCVVAAVGQGPPMKLTRELPPARDTSPLEIRAARAAYFDQVAAPGGIALDAQDPAAPAPPPVFRTPPPMGELPQDLADAIVVGKIVNVQAFLSNSRGAVYTESTIRVEEVIDSRQTVSSSRAIVVVQEGGTIVTPAGRTLAQEVRGGGKELEKGGEYLFFLRNLPALKAYGCRKAWQLANGIASAVSADDLRRAADHTSIYQGMPVERFLAVARTLKASRRGDR